MGMKNQDYAEEYAHQHRVDNDDAPEDQELYEAIQSRNLDKITELLHGATKELQESNDRYEKANAKVFYDYQEQVSPWQELQQDYAKARDIMVERHGITVSETYGPPEMQYLAVDATYDVDCDGDGYFSRSPHAYGDTPEAAIDSLLEVLSELGE